MDRSVASDGFKRRRYQAVPTDLEAKAAAGGSIGYAGLEENGDGWEAPQDNEESIAGGLYGQRITASSASSIAERSRTFHTPKSTHSIRSRKAPPSEHSRQSRFSRATTFTKSSGKIPAVHIVCAISENRARETCVASLDAGSPISLHVTKQGNGQAYEETMAYLDILKPDEILINEGRKSSPLTRKILEMYGQEQEHTTFHHVPAAGKRQKSRRKRGKSTKNGVDADDGEQDPQGPCHTSTAVKFISRGCFDQTKGAELLRKVAREETYCASIIEEYILLASAYAVLLYTQHTLGINYANGTLFLTVNAGGSNKMLIDRSTLLQLELLANAKTGSSKNSLIGTIDKTKTTIGSRLLRSNLIAPPNQVDTINARLDLVDKFLASDDLFYAVHEHLTHLPDMDKMLSNIALIPKRRPGGNGDQNTSVRLASKGVSALVCIKSCLSAIPALAQVLKPHLPDVDVPDHVSMQSNRNSLLVGLGGDRSIRSGSTSTQPGFLLRAIYDSMTRPELAIVRAEVTKAFKSSAEFSRNAEAMRHQVCFALKNSEGGLLDVLRSTYLHNVDDIYRLADVSAEETGYSCAVRYTASRGYFLAIPRDQVNDLPPRFIQASISGKNILCTTEEIMSLNARARTNVSDMVVNTFDRVQEILATVRHHYDALALLCDAIAIIDMCHSFADHITLVENGRWCRPIVYDESYTVGDESVVNKERSRKTQDLIIENGFFGIDVSTGVDEETPFVPNDIIAKDGKHFTTIVGINGSGKSTYIKQLAIIVVLASCGSYVPAEKCVVPVRDRLCARLGTTDDQESNISTFLQEMIQTRDCCQNATSRSLVLLDELGRATSNEDGVSIAWAVAEYLLKRRALVFCVTHFSQLTRLADVYPIAVQNVHMAAMISEGEHGQISYTYKAKAGASQMKSDYGVRLATACGWPTQTVTEASRVEKQIADAMPTDGPVNHNSSSDKRLGAFRTLDKLGKALEGLASNDVPESFDSYIQKIKSIKDTHLPSCDEETLVYFEDILFPETNRDERNKEGHAKNVKDDDSNSGSSSSSGASSLSSTGSESGTYA